MRKDKANNLYGGIHDYIEDYNEDRDDDDQIDLSKLLRAKLNKTSKDGGYTGDDFGGQGGLMFSPRLWREVFKPRYKKLWSVFKEANLPVFHHSCGDIREILPDMIEIGLDVLNPVQPQAMPIEELADKYGKNLTFWGGISVQKTLPFGTREEVKEEVYKSIQVLGRYNRYIVRKSLSNLCLF